ncbi:phage tail protein [Vibrio parahaemolyticus]|uniref:phage tail-collar fiber domain-containing protein n=1 Tax=Vibrio parahaemolyticus TaxID=670 RepID=UPI00301CC609
MSDEGLKLVITRRGLDAAISAKEKGIKAALKWVSVGDAAYTPNKEQKVLQNELARVEFGEYKDTSGSSIQAAAKFSGPEEYAIREIGFWLDDGTLFGVISAPDTTLNYKAKNAHCIQPFTLNLSDLPSDSITVIVGTENLNILIDAEFAIMAKSQVDTMHLAIKHEFRLLELEKAVG